MSQLERFPQEQTDAPSGSGALRLNLSGGGLCWRLPFCRTELHRALSAMLRAAGSGPAELDLILVRDAGMADYNLRYMGCHGPTNVLSFPIDEQIAAYGRMGTSTGLDTDNPFFCQITFQHFTDMFGIFGGHDIVGNNQNL